jgi:hypothetical protein
MRSASSRVGSSSDPRVVAPVIVLPSRSQRSDTKGLKNAIASNQVAVAGAHNYILRGALTILGVSREIELNVSYLGQWLTPWWEEEEGKWVDKGPRVRAGFLAKTRINRHDFGVSWNDVVDKGGVVVGNTIEITIDAEAILEIPRTGTALPSRTV